MGNRALPYPGDAFGFHDPAVRYRDLPKKKLSLENRFGLSLNVKPIKWGSLSRLDKILAAVLAAVIILAIGSLYYTAAIPAAGEKFTEFYLLGSDGKAEGYPRVMKTGETKEVILGTVNHEGRQVSYTVQVRMDGEVKRQLGPFQADNEEKRKSPSASG